MNAHSQSPTTAASFAPRFVRHDPSGIARKITAVLVGIWPKGTQPRSAKAASKRAKVMNGQADPIGYAYTITVAAIDDGKPVGIALQWAKDLIAAVEAYAARHERSQSSGLLAFPDRATRAAVRVEREECEADIARMQMQASCLESLRKARTERLEAIAAAEAEVEVITGQIAMLQASQG